MGSSMKEKQLRNHRKVRFIKSDSDHDPLVQKIITHSSFPELTLKTSDYHQSSNHDDDDEIIRNPNPNFDESGWGYCNEDQLEELLFKHLDSFYSDAISKLVALGYDEAIAQKAILQNGYCDDLSNLVHNSISYLNSNNLNLEKLYPTFVDLRQLEEHSVAGMVGFLQQLRPNLSRGDAMWCLLMSEFQLRRASTMEIPTLPTSSNFAISANGDGETVNSNLIGFTPGLFRFHGGWGFGGGEVCEFQTAGPFPSSFDPPTIREIECPARFNLTPPMKSLLQRNVAMFAAGFQSNVKSSVVVSSQELSLEITSGSEFSHENPCDSHDSDVVSSVVGSLGNLSLEDNSDGKPDDDGGDSKCGMVWNLAKQIKELEGRSKDRREWANQKAAQAAKKLTNDLLELKTLRLEKEDNEWLKNGKQVLEDTTMKRLSEMENALRKASGQVDRANSAVRRLETENAEVRAEMEACKLGASESDLTCLEIAKREKKFLKRLQASDKQNAKLLEELLNEKQKTTQLQELSLQTKGGQKETEVNWKQEMKAKDLALAKVEEERKLKESTETSIKCKQDTLRHKVEIDFQRHNDDIDRLEQELSYLRASSNPTNALSTGDVQMEKPQKDTNSKMLEQLSKLLDSSDDMENCHRECLICMANEVSVVFLPCAHQVLCANCNEDYGSKKGKAKCPICNTQIDQRINVYGASS